MIKPKLKIAHVCPYYEPAICGVKQVVKEIAARQAKLGNDVHIFTSNWDKEKRIKKRFEIIDNIKVHRCRHYFKVANFVTFFPSVFSELIRGKFDIIHSHVFGHPHFVLSALAAKLSGAKHIHTTHCPWTDAYRSTAGKIGLILSYNIFSRFAVKLTDKIIAITPWELSYIQKYGGNKNKIKVLSNGMSEEFFNKITPKKNDFKKKHKIPEKDKVILFFGRLNITKAPDKFVEIAKLILKERKNITFVIIGPDEGMKNKVKEMIKSEKKILLLDAIRDRKEVIKMYQSADIFVLPSYREGLPLTLFEAMASGLPIVASPVNGVPYEMKELENGFLVKYGNIKKYAERINELLNNPKLMKNISQNNKKKAQNYRWDLINERTLSIYNQLLQRKR